MNDKVTFLLVKNLIGRSKKGELLKIGTKMCIAYTSYLDFCLYSGSNRRGSLNLWGFLLIAACFDASSYVTSIPAV